MRDAGKFQPSHGERCPWCGRGVTARPENVGADHDENRQGGVRVACPAGCMGASVFVAVGDPADADECALAVRKGFSIWARGR